VETRWESESQPVGYDKSGEMDKLCGALPDVTPHAAIDSEMKVEERRNPDRVR